MAEAKAKKDGTDTVSDPVQNGKMDKLSNFPQETINEFSTFLIHVNGDALDKLDDDKLVHGYKLAIVVGIRAVETRILFFNEMCRRFKTYAKKRNGMDTLADAFTKHGLNYNTEWRAVDRATQRLLEDAQPPVLIAPNAEMVVKKKTSPLCGATVTVPKDDGISKEILVTKTVDNVATSYKVKRPDLCSVSVWKKKQEEEKGKQVRIDSKAANTAVLADLALKLIGLLVNAPKSDSPVAILAVLRETAEAAYENLSADQAKLIAVPKLVSRLAAQTKIQDEVTKLQATIEKMTATESDLRTTVGNLRTTITQLKHDNKQLTATVTKLEKAAGKSKKKRATTPVSTPAVREFVVGRLSNPYPNDPHTHGVFPKSVFDRTREAASSTGNEAECLKWIDTQPVAKATAM
jgi:myosin heavy subunit